MPKSLNINGAPWSFRTTPLALRVNDQPRNAIVNVREQSILVSLAAEGSVIARAAAEAVASVTSPRPLPLIQLSEP